LPEEKQEPAGDKPPEAGKLEKLRLLPRKIASEVKPVDPRFTPFRDAIEAYWRFQSPALPMPWDASEAKKLHELLKAWPALDLSSFQRMLNNLSASDVVHTRRPRVWLGSIGDYANGPVDRYGKPAARNAPGAAVGSHAPSDDPEVAAGLAEVAIRAQAAEDAAKNAAYARAVQVVFDAGTPSAIAIQRGMKVTYAYAVAWLDRMEREGIVRRTQHGFELQESREVQPC
jgi:hypothetical protein